MRPSLRAQVDDVLARLDKQEAEAIRRWLDLARERREKVVER